MENIDELIAKKLAGETNPDETITLDSWLADTPENRQYFQQMEKIWRQVEVAKTFLPRALDVEAALAKTKTKIKNLENRSAAPRGKVVFFQNWMLAAAAAMAVVLAAIFFFRQKPAPQNIEIAALETVRRETLTDGSVVSLNQNSNLRGSFSGKSRKVKLQGEAFFKVAADREKPFVVEVRNLEVAVVGTAFNVDNRSDSAQVTVEVSEGVVELRFGNSVERLTAGERAVFDCQTGKIQKSKLPAAARPEAWFDRKFDFDETPLAEVLPLLEKTYNVRISLENKDLENCKLHTRFENLPIERILEVLAETFSFRIVAINGGHFLLEGGSCE